MKVLLVGADPVGCKRKERKEEEEDEVGPEDPVADGLDDGEDFGLGEGGGLAGRADGDEEVDAGIDLEFDQAFLGHYLPCFNSVLQNSMNFMYRLMGEHVRTIGTLADVESVHQSALDRVNLPKYIELHRIYPSEIVGHGLGGPAKTYPETTRTLR